ncbi:lasso peptide biosynthesis PqqD family chaperone [Streptomyces sp. NPDC050617]|uniref:lasso peptide biosynthesis PqqD family chaperone n=1 Tax=Streptomyces sp. NPDC050617 TaxID=3154628 RepID=UPI0034290DD9
MHRLRRDVSACATDDGMVLLDERAGRYWQLNTTGALILNTLLDGATPQQTAHRLATTHPVTHERALTDVTALIDHLTQEHLVTTS